jgi:hypothetical protein
MRRALSTFSRLTQQLRHYMEAWDQIVQKNLTTPRKNKSGTYDTHLWYSTDSGSHMYVAEMSPRIASGSLAAVG